MHGVDARARLCAELYSRAAIGFAGQIDDASLRAAERFMEQEEGGNQPLQGSAADSDHLLLLKAPAGAEWWQVDWIIATATAGIASLAGGAQNWVFVRCLLWERLALITAGLLLVYPHSLADLVGLALLALAMISQVARNRKQGLGTVTA